MRFVTNQTNRGSNRWMPARAGNTSGRLHIEQTQGLPGSQAPAQGVAWRVLLWGVVFGIPLRYALLQRNRSFSDYSVDASAMVEALVVAFGLILVLVNQRIWILLRTLGKSGMWALIAFQALCILSTVWSEIPMFSAYQSVKYFTLFCAIALAMSYCRDVLDGERFAIWASIAALLITLSGHLLHIGFDINIRSMHTNSYAGIGALIACYCFGELRGSNGRRKRMLWIAFTVSLASVIIGTSGTCNIALLIGVSVAYGVSRRSFAAPILGVICLLILTSIMGLAWVQETLLPNKTENEIQTLSNRTLIWDYCIDMGWRRPLTGWGFDATTRLNTDAPDNTAHNAFVGAFADTGVFGVSLLALWFVWAAAQIVRCIRRNSPRIAGITGVMVVGMVLCMSTPFVGTEWSPQAIAFYSFMMLFYLAIVPSSRAPIPHQMKVDYGKYS